jgi:hypothetical protein
MEALRTLRGSRSLIEHCSPDHEGAANEYPVSEFFDSEPRAGASGLGLQWHPESLAIKAIVMMVAMSSRIDSSDIHVP